MCRSSLRHVCVYVCEGEGGGGADFRMSGAVSGHQSARQRQAEQIISRDGERGEREREGMGKARVRRECRDRAEGRPRRCVFNIRLVRITQTGLRAAQSRNRPATPKSCPLAALPSPSALRASADISRFNISPLKLQFDSVLWQ